VSTPGNPGPPGFLVFAIILVIIVGSVIIFYWPDEGF